MTINVTIPEMLEVLAQGHPGAKIVGLVTLTFPELHKISPFRNGVTRLAHRNVVLGANYAAAVNRTRLGEIEKQITAIENDPYLPLADKTGLLLGLRNALNSVEYFRAEALWHGYGQSIPGQTYVVTHRTKGGLYFAAKPHQLPTSDPFNETGTVAPVVADEWRDLANNRVIDIAEVRPYLKNSPHKAHKQAVNHDVLWRTMGIDGGGDKKAGYVLQLRYAGQHYTVTHNN